MINGSIFAGACVATFILGCLLTAAAAWVFFRRHTASRQSLSSSPLAVVQPPLKQRNFSWKLEPEGYNEREHDLITQLDREHVKQRTQILQILIRDMGPSTQCREPVPADASLSVAGCREKFGDKIDWTTLDALLRSVCARGAGLSYLLSHLIFYSISLVKSESCPPSWNLLSPQLASLFHEIEDSSKNLPHEQQEWVLWCLEKSRIYTCEGLYPNICPTNVLINEERYQPPANLEAQAKMMGFIEELLEPYVLIDDVFRKDLQRLLTIAGRLGVCIHKSLQPWC